jgi:Fic-DOC domain mobile mystery protein B
MIDETEPEGATPGDDISGLIATSLHTREARNAAETDSISRAYDKYIYRARAKTPDSKWLTDEFIRNVHAEMFGAIWDWAGKYRTVQTNIGVKPYQIQEQIQVLCGNFYTWDSGSMDPIEIVARLQSRLTWIHPFKDGNGRHARLITDIFLYSRQHPLPQWPQIHLMTQGNNVRQEYIAAMRKADDHDFSALSQFIESYIPTNPPRSATQDSSS